MLSQQPVLLCADKTRLYSKCLALKLSSPSRLQLQPIIRALGVGVILKADWWELHAEIGLQKHFIALFLFVSPVRVRRSSSMCTVIAANGSFRRLWTPCRSVY